MKLIANIFNKLRPNFEKGGKLERLQPLFEATEAFMFVTPKRTKDGVHIRDHMDTKWLMSIVILAVFPCLLFGMYNVGYQYYLAADRLAEVGVLDCFLKGARYVLPIVIVSYAAGGVWEVLFAIVRKHEINEGFFVTGMLLPLILPPTIPLWQVAVGVSFGVVIGKEVFGGTGMNVFNPALVARAFLFFAYAPSMSGDKVWAVVPANAEALISGYSGATPLAYAAAQVSDPAVTGGITQAISNFGGGPTYSWLSMFLGRIPGSIGETSALLCLVGALILILTRVGSWRIMVGGLAGAAVMASGMKLLAGGAGSLLALPVHYHFVMGGFAFGLVFMATDPVSAAQTRMGKWIYGFGIGLMVIIIRVVNPAYPEGMMFSILFLNAFAPLIDYYVVQRHIARRRKRGKTA